MDSTLSWKGVFFGLLGDLFAGGGGGGGGGSCNCVAMSTMFGLFTGTSTVCIATSGLLIGTFVGESIGSL